MSLLEQQLKELQIKKQKISYFQEIAAMLENLSKPDDQTVYSSDIVEARKEVVQELAEFLHLRISAIESGRASVPEDGEELLILTQDEIAVLKEMVERVNRPAPRREAAPQRPNRRPLSNKGAFASDEDDYQDEEMEEPPAPRRQQNRQKANMAAQRNAGRQDIVAFAMQHRGLDGKRVTFTTKNGQTMGGKVVGTEMPNIVVQTDTGHTIGIPPEELTVG